MLTNHRQRLVDRWIKLLEEWEAKGSPLYVVVNLDHPAYGYLGKPGWYHVMPPDEPHTYPDMQEAAEQVASLIEEFGHNLDSVGVFKLERVDIEKLRPLVNKALEELKEDE